jgi:gliding motility-associated-like protein
MIKKLLSLLIMACLTTALNAQIFTVYENDFEDAGSDWTYTFSGGPNQFIRNTCATNGPSAAGTTAMYITQGGVTPDCSPTGMFQFSYANAASGSSSAIASHEIDATCTGTLNVSFDYRIEGQVGQDFAELVYSTNGGASYNVVSVLPISSGWTTFSIGLPALLDFSTFRIGFRFTCDAAGIPNTPLAIDNFELTGTDTGAPVINTCQTNLNLNLNSSCQALIGDYTPTVTVTDNCSDVSKITFVQNPLPNTVTLTQHGQTQLVTITVTDLAGNSAQCSFTITAVDAIEPDVTCPTIPPVPLNASCEASVPDISSLVVWSDNCTSPANIILSQTPVAGTLVATDQIIQFTVTDQGNNSKVCSTSMTVVDQIAPSLTCPANQTLNGDANCSANLIDYTGLVTFIENCSFTTAVTLVQSPAVGTNFNSPTLVTITGTDEAGNPGTCSFTVSILDATGPAVTCPANYTISTGSNCNAIMPNIASQLSITENCTSSTPYTYSQTPTIGSTLPTGPNAVSVIVMDILGNMGSCNFTLTVSDLTAPEISCNGNVTIPIDANCSGTLGNYTTNVTVSDNCSLNTALTITQSPAAGTVITENTQIIMTVSDEAGNSNTCNFFAIVDDNQDPTITCPTSLDVTINSSCAYTVPDLSAQVTGTDNCNSFAEMTLTQNPAPGTPETGMTAVLFTITDLNGNQNTCVTMLIPDDTETPVVTCPSPAPVNNGSSCDFVLPNYGTQTLVLDNCSNFTIEQTPTPGSTIQAGTTTIEILVSDVAGNLATCTFDLTVLENVQPTITCPGTISSCDPEIIFLDPMFNDNCDAILTQTDNTGYSSGSTFPVGSTILQYTVTDLSGNSASCSFVVEVLDFPAQANILEDTIQLCDLTSTVVSAEAHTTGTGEWTVEQGTGNFNNQFANSTGVNNLTYGTNVLYYTIGSVSCGSTVDSVYVIAYQQPLPASTQDQLLACNASQIALLSNTPLYGDGVWTTSDNSAVIADATSSNTTASNLSTGWNDYIWTITNGSCPSTSDTMSVYVSAIAEISTPDTLLCFENQSLELVGNSPAEGQNSYWKFIKGVGVFSSSTDPSTMVTGLNLGENIIVYTMTHPQCPSTTDTVTIVTQLCEDINPEFPTVITPNNDGKNDLFVINFLEQIYPDLTVTIFNRWGSVVFESTGYQVPWDGTHNGEELPMGTYFYKIELNDESNTVYTGPISIIH